MTKKPHPPLTLGQSLVLDFIRRFIERNQYPPTYREIAEAHGWSAQGAVEHVKALERKGAVTRQAGRTRTLRIIDARLMKEAAATILEQNRVNEERLPQNA